MYERITILALIVAALSITAAGIVYFHCRRMQREKNCSIARALHEQDQLKKKLEHVCIEKRTIEKILTSKLSDLSDPPDVPGVPPDAPPPTTSAKPATI